MSCWVLPRYMTYVGWRRLFGNLCRCHVQNSDVINYTAIDLRRRNRQSIETSSSHNRSRITWKNTKSKNIIPRGSLVSLYHTDSWYRRHVILFPPLRKVRPNTLWVYETHTCTSALPFSPLCWISPISDSTWRNNGRIFIYAYLHKIHQHEFL
jgi:hypothetical protein